MSKGGDQCFVTFTAGEGPGGSHGGWGTVVGKGQTYTTKKDLENEEFSGCWEVGSMGGEREIEGQRKRGKREEKKGRGRETKSCLF